MIYTVLSRATIRGSVTCSCPITSAKVSDDNDDKGQCSRQPLQLGGADRTIHTILDVLPPARVADSHQRTHHTTPDARPGDMYAHRNTADTPNSQEPKIRYTGSCLLRGVILKTPPGPEGSKGIRAMTGARRFFIPKIRHLDSLHPSYALRAAPLTLRGFGSGFVLRSLRIRILSGCVGGFSCPK